MKRTVEPGGGDRGIYTPLACCAASRATTTIATDAQRAPGAGTPPALLAQTDDDPALRHEFVALDGGEFLMGTDDPQGFPADGEGPVRAVTLRPFALARHAVTVAEFAAFVAATGYVTEAERFGWSFVFHRFLPRARRGAVRGNAGDAPWWLAVDGACWSAPAGPGSTTVGRQDHPVVHVSWHDAAAYCA